MTNNKIKFKLKGHESFQIREGWLRKGIKGIQNDSTIFNSKNATDKLGIGNNMVKSIRFWLQATGLTKEINIKGSKKGQELTKDFGEIINEYDPYFEDIFTLWLIHYKLVINKDIATSWYLFFNEFNLDEFNKNQMFEGLNMLLKKFSKNSVFSEKSLADDCDCIIKTYFSEKNKNRNPEDNTICPLTELELLDYIPNSNIYIKKKPNIEKLDKLVVLYIILDNVKEGRSTDIDKILNEPGNVGKVLNFDRNILNEYLDLLQDERYLEINRTAGLDKVYIKTTMSQVDIMKLYYNQI